MKKLIKDAKKFKKTLVKKNDILIIDALIKKVINQQNIIENYEKMAENSMFSKKEM